MTILTKHIIIRSPYTGRNVWWLTGDDLPPSYQYLRDATTEETALITEIEAGTAANNTARMVAAAKILKSLLNPPEA